MHFYIKYFAHLYKIYYTFISNFLLIFIKYFAHFYQIFCSFSSNILLILSNVLLILIKCFAYFHQIFLLIFIKYFSHFHQIFCSFYQIISTIILVGRVCANGPGDLGSIPGHVLSKTFKMVLDTALLNTQQYKVRIKGKVEQVRERSSALSKREPSGHP